MTHTTLSPLSDALKGERPEDIFPQGLDSTRRHIAEFRQVSPCEVAVGLNGKFTLYCLLLSLAHTNTQKTQPIVYFPSHLSGIEDMLRLVGFIAIPFDSAQDVESLLTEPDRIVAVIFSRPLQHILASQKSRSLVLRNPLSFIFIESSLTSNRNSWPAKTLVFQYLFENEHFFFLGQMTRAKEELGYLIATKRSIDRFSIIHRTLAVGASISSQKISASFFALPRASIFFSKQPIFENASSETRGQPLGLPWVREKVATFVKTSMANLMLTRGSCMALTSAMQGLRLLELVKKTNGNHATREHILCPLPHFPGYPGSIGLAGFKPVYYEVGSAALIPGLKRLVTTNNPVAILLNFPHNPTGRILSEHEWRQILQLAEYQKMHLLLDETFVGLEYTNHGQACFSIDHPLLIRCGGFSKRFPSLSDVRLGYLIAPPAFLHLASEIHQTMSGEPAATSQKSVGRFLQLTNPTQQVQLFGEELRRHRDLALKRLTACSFFIRVHCPQSGYFICVQLPDEIDCAAFSQALRKATGLWCANALSFGVNSENWIRFRFAESYENLVRNIDRLIQFCENSGAYASSFTKLP